MRLTDGSLILAGLIGGLIGARLDGLASKAWAEINRVELLHGRLNIRAEGNQGTLSLTRLEGDGSGLFFYNPAGHIRLSGAVFPDGRFACFGLMSKDHDINPKLFFRMDGGNPGPMVFFKNSRDQHRIDLGLDISGADEDPYLVYFDKHGGKHAVFGQFPYIGNAGGTL